MAQFLVISGVADVPTLGNAVGAQIYRGDHTDAAAAATAASQNLKALDGSFLWVLPAGSAARYVANVTPPIYSAVVG